MYMHLLLPGVENEINSFSKASKNIFYEVGCKIFEINKVYR